ncbi:tRNA (guanine(26)-N(2))-dimethyltransferase [Halobacteria archaeon AArc-dxtr1]|nr:tRNA (guanine(26)-N(2))-dimethyltransferase [Halobacteria archaeon AArc-dxtr1]
MRVTEGGVEIAVPGEQTEGFEESVFYNPRQELNRDLTIAVLRAYREREPRAERYLDGMAASGVRGVRAAADGWDVTCCDIDEGAVSLARENFERNDLEGEVVRRNVNALLHDSMFDVVDLDPFGTPMPFADAAFANCHNLVCVTATDTAPLCGAHFASGVRSYGSVPRNTEYHPEMGVRTLLSALARSAARFDVGITPLVTHATSHYVRTYLELDRRATAADATLSELGTLSHCEDCLYRETQSGLIANTLEACPNCGGDRILAAGPLWLGATVDLEFTATVREAIPDEFATAETARDLIETLAGELAEPTHYDQHKLCKNWGLPANAMDDFLADLRKAGYRASPAHYGGTTFKTDADVGEIRAATASELTD